MDRLRTRFTPPGGSSGWALDSINIENFKSYAGRTRIGPLQRFPFIAIVGPNGSGKSNLMDAISFVMGEKTTSLRVRRLDDLIHGASIGKPIATTASVSAAFKRTDNSNFEESQTEVTFTRTIRGAGSEYMINTMVVTQQIYFNALKDIGINAKGKNFLVFQGAIESIALKNSKERTALLEEICGTVTMKNEYEQAKVNLAEAEKNIEKSYLKKKNIFAERKEILMKIQEADAYNQLLEEMSDKETEIALFKLYNIQRDLDSSANEYYMSETKVNRLVNMKRKYNEELEQKKKARGEIHREVAQKESLMQKMDKERNKKMPKQIEVNQKVKHLEKRLTNAEKSLKQAQGNKDNHDQDLEQLRKNLGDANEKMQEFLQLHNDTQLAEGLDITLQDSQMTEYWDLKQKVLKKTQKEKSAMDGLAKLKKDKDDVFNSLNLEKVALDGKLNIKDHEIKAEHKLAEKVRENIEELKELLKTKEAEAQPLKRQIQVAEKKINELHEQFETISSEIEAEKNEVHVIKRQKRKREVIRALKDNFNGVFDRVTNLCKPDSAKYEIAITKVIGNKMDAIVVDSAKTAKQCIQYLQDQMLEPESFLPLDLLQVKPLRTRFRDLRDKRIYLAIDLLSFDAKVELAIRHCTKSTVVCHSSDLAKKVATGELCGESTNAVSLEGTMYNSNGTISGGMAELRRRALRWSDRELIQKEEQKIKIQEELRENMRITRNAMTLQSLEHEIVGIKKRLEYAKANLKIHTERAKELEADSKIYEADRRNIENRWTEANKGVYEVAEKMTTYKNKINSVEDAIFESFCEQVGIPNIRAYEEKDVRAREEFNRGRQDLENKINEIQVQIDDEISHEQTLIDNIKRWENTVSEILENLERCKSEMEQIKQEMTVVEKKIAKAKEEKDEMERTVDAHEKEIKAVNQQIIATEKLLLQAQKAKTRLENSRYQIKLQRHELYRQCKLAETVIPFLVGSLDAIRVTLDSNVSSGEPLEAAIREEDGLKVDFQKLSEENQRVIGNARMDQEKILEHDLSELERKIGSFKAPNLKANEKLTDINARVQQQNAEYEEFRKKAREAKQAFADIKKKRYDRFMDCYEKLSQNIDAIYKGLTQNESAQAVLGLDNMEEPYMEGVSYHCVAPGKTFQSMNNLSGGEKTLAALALLFAIQSYEPAPFFVLDEIDAALDNTNICKVTSYIRQRSRNLQVLVISLKEEFFKETDALIGIAPAVQPSECIRSEVYSLDLTRYLDND